MRLFTAVDLPEDVRGRLERLLSHLRPTAHLKWSPVYNLHITMKFIGEWPVQDLEKLERALRALPRRSAISIDVKGLGWYPNPHYPRVFWAGAHGGPDLERLARDLDAALEPLGIAVEDREFAPHLTLARIKRPVPLQSLRQAVADLDSVDFGAFQATRFDLYRSQPGPAGSVYTKLSEYPFTAE
jgi:RNA 2',3'-cyclic 3'-phosphodiesterase